MMEPLKTTTMHISETKSICSTLTCSKSENDEIAKKLEEELLYGADNDGEEEEEDGDEEDALSDDSLRLRLSDDEVDGEDSATTATATTNSASCRVNSQLKTVVKTEALDLGSDIDGTANDLNKSVSNSQVNYNNYYKHESQSLETDFTDDNAVIEHNFCDNGAQNKIRSDKLLNKFPPYDNNFIYNNTNNNCNSSDNDSLSGDKSISSDDFNECAYGYAYYNNHFNFGRKKPHKTGVLSNNNNNKNNNTPNNLPKQENEKICPLSIIITTSDNTATEKSNVSADSITPNTDGCLNGIIINNTRSINDDTNTPDDTESTDNSDNNNLTITKTDTQLSKSRDNSDAKSPLEDNATVDSVQPTKSSFSELDDDKIDNYEKEIDDLDNNIRKNNENESVSNQIDISTDNEKSDESKPGQESAGVNSKNSRDNLNNDNSNDNIKNNENNSDDSVCMENNFLINDNTQNVDKHDTNVKLNLTNSDSNSETFVADDHSHQHDDDVVMVNDNQSSSSNTPNIICNEKMEVTKVLDDSEDDKKEDKKPELEPNKVKSAEVSTSSEVNEAKPDIKLEKTDVKIEMVERTNSKRRLSGSDEESNACKKVPTAHPTPVSQQDDDEAKKDSITSILKFFNSSSKCKLEPKEDTKKCVDEILNKFSNSSILNFFNSSSKCKLEIEENKKKCDDINVCKESKVAMELDKLIESGENKITDDNADKESTTDDLNGDSCSTNGTDGENSNLPVEMSAIDAGDDSSKKEDDDSNDKVESTLSRGGSTSHGKRRRKRRKPPTSATSSANQLKIQEKENVRQKRETAQKAQEMIRKLNNESDSDTEEMIMTYKSPNQTTPNVQPLSLPSLKRNSGNTEDISDTVTKKPKNNDVTNFNTNVPETSAVTSADISDKKTLSHVRNFFLRDSRQKLAKLTQEQLEELLIQKVIETITMRDEIGRLREQAKISERNQEATRVKCQQLAKQIKDFEMVLTRFAADRRISDKTASPIKINRSVGLQVSFISDAGIQNLRQIQNVKSSIQANSSTPIIRSQNDDSLNTSTNSRKGIKVHSPRRSEISIAPASVSTAAPTVNPIATIHPPVSLVPIQSSTTLVMSKPIENRQTVITSAAPTMVTQMLPNTIALNGVQLHNANRPPKVLNVRCNNSNNSINSNNTHNNSSNNENLIDLTGEEEKNKQPQQLLPAVTIQAKDPPSLQKVPQQPPRYQRIVQSSPASVTNVTNVTIPSSAIRVIQPTDKPTPTAILNNMNAPRLTFVMKGGVGQPQLVIASPNQVRPVGSTAPRSTFSTIAYTGVQTIPNASVRVVPAASIAPSQKSKHPAALPSPTNYPLNSNLKLPPPAPSLKISKVSNGIVLSWNMALSDRYAEIASYQLYAYQEISGMAPSTTMWKKVGDVRALALPMACTLTQFSEGNNYYFAVRAVDRHSRLGQYSQPGSISL